MTLLTTVLTAIIFTVIWYKDAPKNEIKVSALCWMYWGAFLMWLVILLVKDTKGVVKAALIRQK